jgi:hypothetical protein
LDDFFRPIRNDSYWEPHCFDIPICGSLRSVFDTLDGIDKLADDIGNVTKNIDKVDVLLPQSDAQLPQLIATLKTVRGLTMATASTFSGLINQMNTFSQNATAIGQPFDAAKNDDSFYLPPEAFQNPDFIRGLKRGRAVRPTHARTHGRTDRACRAFLLRNNRDAGRCRSDAPHWCTSPPRAPDAGEDYTLLAKQFPTPSPSSGRITGPDGYAQLSEDAFLQDFTQDVDLIRAKRSTPSRAEFQANCSAAK